MYWLYLRFCGRALFCLNWTSKWTCGMLRASQNLFKYGGLAPIFSDDTKKKWIVPLILLSLTQISVGYAIFAVSSDLFAEKLDSLYFDSIILTTFFLQNIFMVICSHATVDKIEQWNKMKKVLERKSIFTQYSVLTRYMVCFVFFTVVIALKIFKSELKNSSHLWSSSIFHIFQYTQMIYLLFTRQIISEITEAYKEFNEHCLHRLTRIRAESRFFFFKEVMTHLVTKSKSLYSFVNVFNDLFGWSMLSVICGTFMNILSGFTYVQSNSEIPGKINPEYLALNIQQIIPVVSPIIVQLANTQHVLQLPSLFCLNTILYFVTKYFAMPPEFFLSGACTIIKNWRLPHKTKWNFTQL